MQHALNIRAVFDEATPEQVAEGAAWYEGAARIAAEVAAEYDLRVEQVAGVIAAVSPRLRWGKNVELARRIVHDHSRGVITTSGYLQIGLTKAARILANEPVLEVLRSSKVRAFYSCIVTAGQTDEVCVDRHAYAVAWNYRGDSNPSITASAYRRIASAYQQVARDVHLPAAQVQAITWVVWRHRYWSTTVDL